MKKLLFYISSLIILYSCNNPAPDAVKYNDIMILKQDSIVTLIDSLDQLISERDTLNMLDFQKHIIKIIDQKIESINNYKEFDNDNGFKTAVIELFTSYRTIITDKYSKIISLSLLNQSSFEKDSLDKFNQTIKEINIEFSGSLDKFLEAQKAFADKYKFSLVEEIKK